MASFPSAPLLATVVICTHNRSAFLSETLEALINQHTPDFAFDILVVDNASTDQTRNILAAFQNKPVPVRYLYVPVLGLAHARNQAIDQVTAPYIAFLDDDAIPAPDWLRTLLGTFDTIQPTPGAVGGRVFLRWTAGQPAWMPDDLLGVYSLLDYGDQVQAVRAVNGCSVAFPGAVAKRYRFDTRLGVAGKNQIPGEDADILNRMRRDNLVIYYQPGAVVCHVVGQYRENRHYLFARSRGLGHAQALLSVIYAWPGRLAVLKLMAQDTWNRRHWWKRMVLGVISGKLFSSPRERTWMRSVLIRWSAFQAQMARFVIKGSAAVPVRQPPPDHSG
jgi:glycosyltransferase involved in cell wall biosynthesis